MSPIRFCLVSCKAKRCNWQKLSRKNAMESLNHCSILCDNYAKLRRNIIPNHTVITPKYTTATLQVWDTLVACAKNVAVQTLHINPGQEPQLCRRTTSRNQRGSRRIHLPRGDVCEKLGSQFSMVPYGSPREKICFDVFCIIRPIP
jgi:hypothetical protein